MAPFSSVTTSAISSAFAKGGYSAEASDNQQRLLTLQDMHPYQERGVNHQLDHPRAMVWQGMGEGKTVTTLTAQHHLQQHGASRGALIVAPLLVAQMVWPFEAWNWDHLQDTRVVLVRGTQTQMVGQLRTRSGFFVTNYENLSKVLKICYAHFTDMGRPLPFDTIIFDEITRLKSARLRGGSVRARAFLAMSDYLPHRVGLTGTPAPNGLVDLFGQYLVIDDGQRLGTVEDAYHSRWFKEDPSNSFKKVPTETGRERIYQQVADITFQTQPHERPKLPPLVTRDVVIDLPPTARKHYEAMEKVFFSQLDSGVDIEAPTKAAAMNKCLQIASGAAYYDPDSPKWEHIHDVKLDMLDDIITWANGRPILLARWFADTEAGRIQDRFGRKVFHLQGGLTLNRIRQINAAWTAGEIPVLMGHPASIGHGLNLQSHNLIVWYSLCWSNELYNQFIARELRQGQKHPRVDMIRIMARDTLDYAQDEALSTKDKTERDLKDSVRAYRNRKYGV